MKKKATFPRMGYYTEAFEVLISGLGYEPLTPPKTSQQTIKLGVRHSADMVCFPFKTTLGNLIQGLDSGAEVVFGIGITPWESAKETCRFAFYSHVQEQILRRMGYNFEMKYIYKGGINILPVLKKTNPDLTYPKVIKAINATWKKIKEIEEKEYKFEKKEINIGIVGEAYTLWEPSVNYDIVNKLRKMGVGVHMSLTLSNYLRHQIHLTKKDRKIEEEIRKYFPKHIGGHGWDSMYNTIWYAKNNFDGVIHLLPLSCMPETMVELSMDMIGEDYKIPIYRFPIDENKFEAGFDTRIETFIKLLKRNKK